MRFQFELQRARGVLLARISDVDEHARGEVGGSEGGGTLVLGSAACWVTMLERLPNCTLSWVCASTRMRFTSAEVEAEMRGQVFHLLIRH